MSRADDGTSVLCGQSISTIGTITAPSAYFIYTSTLLKAKPDPTFRAILAAFLPWARLRVRGNLGHAMPQPAQEPASRMRP